MVWFILNLSSRHTLERVGDFSAQIALVRSVPRVEERNLIIHVAACLASICKNVNWPQKFKGNYSLKEKKKQRHEPIPSLFSLLCLLRARVNYSIRKNRTLLLLSLSRLAGPPPLGVCSSRFKNRLNLWKIARSILYIFFFLEVFKIVSFQTFILCVVGPFAVCCCCCCCSSSSFFSVGSGENKI